MFKICNKWLAFLMQGNQKTQPEWALLCSNSVMHNQWHYIHSKVKYQVQQLFNIKLDTGSLECNSWLVFMKN
jgi:hypothetical protein